MSEGKYDARRVPLRLETIPRELRELRQWVAWKVTPARAGEKKPRKIPINPQTGANAKSNDASSWGSFEQAVACMRRRKLAGVGFVFTDGDPFCGVDLDHCRDPRTGDIAPWAREFIDELATYTEVSPSGTGVHCIARGTLPDRGRKEGNVEMYSERRFFCITGAILPASHATIEERTTQLARVHMKAFGRGAKRGEAGEARSRPSRSSGDDHALLIERARQYVAKAPGVSEGSRNTRAFQLAGHLAVMDEHGVVLTDAELLEALAEWNARNDPPLSESELRSCVANGRSKGTPPPPKRSARSDPARPAPSSGHAGPPLTDIGNAERLVEAHGRDIRFCLPLGGWRLWDGRRWQADALGKVELFAKAVARNLFEQAQCMTTSNRAAEKQRELMQRFALASENDARIRAALRRARVEPAVAVRPEQFDADGYLLNVQNGTLDLRTGQLRPHRREDLCTKLAPTHFDPGARCEAVEEFLNSATNGDTQFRSYLERALGYSLIAERRLDVLFILSGPSRTGKTTLLEALRHMLGDYATTIPFSALLERERGSAPRPALVDARGSRIAVASEAPDGGMFDAAMLKAVTGGDTVNARRLHENPVQFRPSYALWLAANEVPRIRDEPATRRRLRLLPFEHVHDGDEGLRERLWEPDAQQALLAIAVRGCNAYQREGLGTCEAVERAAQRYWGDLSNPTAAVDRFIEQCCVRDPAASCPTGVLFERFVELEGADRVSLTKFGELLGARGFQKKRTNKVTLRLGLRLIEPTASPDRHDAEATAPHSPTVHPTGSHAGDGLFQGNGEAP